MKTIKDQKVVMEAPLPPKKAYSLKKRIQLGIGLPAWVLFGFLASSLVVGGIILALQYFALVDFSKVNESFLQTVLAGMVYLLSLAVVIGIPLKLKISRITKKDLGLDRPPNWLDILLAPGGYIAHILLAAGLTSLIAYLFKDFDMDQAQDVGFGGITQYYEYVLAFVTLVIIAPVAEEVLVRGYLHGRLRAIMPIVASAIITSLLFSLMHFQWNVAVALLPLGLVLIGLREVTGSIWAGIFLHMINNGVAFYLLFINPSVFNTIVG